MRCVLAAMTVFTLGSIGGSALADVDPQITDAIKKVKPSDYPSANTLMVINDQTVVYQPDGEFTNTMHVAQLVLTNVGSVRPCSDR